MLFWSTPMRRYRRLAAPANPALARTASHSVAWSGCAPRMATSAAIRNTRWGRRHMHLYATTSEQFGIIAVGQRQWAQLSPWAQMKRPMTLEDHHNSRFIAEPLRLLDCCLVSNSAVAVVVTLTKRARDPRQPPANVLGYAQCAPGDNLRTDRHPGVETGAKRSAEIAFRRPESPGTTSAFANSTTAIPTPCS